MAVASTHSVSTPMNISDHIKSPSSSSLGPAEFLSRGLQQHLDSHSKASAAQGQRSCLSGGQGHFACSSRASSFQAM